MSFLSPDSSNQTAAAPALPKVESEASLPPVLAPQGSKPKQKTPRSTFMGSGGDNGGAMGQASGNAGGKTLLGM